MTRAPSGTGITNPLILHMNTVEPRETATRPMNVESTFAYWRLNQTRTWKIALDLQKSAPTENRNTLPSFRAWSRISSCLFDDERCLDFARHDNHLFGSARRIKSPSQSGFATPSRYARSDSTEEFTRRLL